jgi:hypothetical protein
MVDICADLQFFSAIFFTINQYYKISGFTLVFWRVLIPLLVISPAIFILDWPNSPIFYMATVTTSLIVTYTDARQLQGAALFGGGITPRTKPFTVWIVFLIWFIADAGQRAELISDIPRFCGIVAALFIGVLAASNLSKCEISREAISYFMPIIISGAIIDVLNKTAMINSSFWEGIIFYAWIQGIIITFLSGSLHGLNGGLSLKSLFEKNTVLVGAMLGSIIIAVTLSKNAAMTYTMNPAYVTAVIFMAPVWVSLYYYAIGHKETADVRSGFVFLLSAIMLVLLSS